MNGRLRLRRSSRDKMKWTILILIMESVTVHSTNFEFLKPSKLQTKTSPEEQRLAAQYTINKYLPNSLDNIFFITVDPTLFFEEKDTFNVIRIEKNGDTHIEIKASSGVAAVWGFNYYLKKYCNCHLGWQVRNIDLPESLPFINETVVANDRFRYYINVCTVSYSFVWWSENDWIEHIGWMAMNGMNLVLAPLGQEEIWVNIYREFGMTEDEIAEHITGPAFLSWLRMGNVRGWAGPLFPSWHLRAKLFQTKIVDYMRKLGIIPALPAFSGHVPQAFRRLFPNATFYTMQQWNKFSDQYCCPLFVDPDDPLFRSIGEKFLNQTTNAYGMSHIYYSDPFNEVKTSSWSTQFVQSVAEAIFSSMQTIDQQAVWLVQNWMFVHDPDLWPRERVESFLKSVPCGRMLILDLQSEQWPQYNAYDMYFGQPFVWCMLHNFGGTLGMFGNMEAITVDVHRARKHDNSTMIGVGLTMEGINQNYIVYDLMLESAWRPHPVSDLYEWATAYAQRRYGCNSTSKAWRYLLKSVYNFHGLNRIRGKYTITRRPSLKIKPWAWYRSRDLLEAWKEFILASNTCHSEAYFHDLCDITRQVLQYRAEQLYLRIVENLKYNAWIIRESINKYLDVMNDMEIILSSCKNFQLYNWILKANMAAEPSEDIMYQLNARNQITLWGPNGEITDYACKQWAGMFEHYYIPRWRLFLEAVLDAKLKNETFNEKITQQIIRDGVETQFVTKEIKEPTYVNNTVYVADLLFKKWFILPDVDDLPMNVIWPDHIRRTTLYTEEEEDDLSTSIPTAVMLKSTTSLT